MLLFLKHSEFLIAAISFSLGFLTQQLFEIEIEWFSLIFISSVAFSFYTLVYALSSFWYAPNTLKSGNPKNSWYLENQRFILFILVFSLMVDLIFLFFLPLSMIFLFLCLSILAGFYSILAVQKKNKFIQLRDHFITKNFFLVLCWLFTTLILPLWQSVEIDWERMIYVGYFYFSWFFINVVLFDLRDYKTDQKLRIRTMPVIFGRFFTLVLLLIFNTSIILTFFHFHSLFSGIGITLIIPNVFYFLYIFRQFYSRRLLPASAYFFADFVLMLPAGFYLLYSY